MVPVIKVPAGCKITDDALVGIPVHGDTIQGDIDRPRGSGFDHAGHDGIRGIAVDPKEAILGGG